MDPHVILAILLFSMAGSAMGTLSGLAPGIHINTLALLTVASSSITLPVISEILTFLNSDPTLAPFMLSSMIISASVVHSFLDFIPSIFLGAPDEEEALSVLPGHRLLLDGRGMEAVSCAAMGSLIGALAALLLCIPLQFVLGPPLCMASSLDILIVPMLFASIIILVLSEKGRPIPRAVLDLRGGRIVRTKEIVTLVRNVPVDGDGVAVRGEIVRKFPFRYRFITSTGSWNVKCWRPPIGHVVAEGVWRVRTSRSRGRTIAIGLLLLSGTLGFVVMSSRLSFLDDWRGLDQSIMFPLLTGLFGMPSLLRSTGSNEMPSQSEDPGVSDHVPAWLGALSGWTVGWFPGITTTCGTMIGSSFFIRKKEEEGAKQFITMVAAVGTSATVFGLLAYVVAGKGRSGALLAVKSILIDQGPADVLLPFFLLSVLIAALIGYELTMFFGRSFAKKVSGTDVHRLSIAIALALFVLVSIFNGVPGLIVLLIATAVGTLPIVLGTSRVHLSGCMLVPLLLYYLGLEPVLISALR